MDEKKLEKLKKVKAKMIFGKGTEREVRKAFLMAMDVIGSVQGEMSILQTFANEVTAEDRLFMSAYGVWKRKAAAEGTTVWVRANPPPIFEPKPPSSVPPILRFSSKSGESM